MHSGAASKDARLFHRVSANRQVSRCVLNVALPVAQVISFVAIIATRSRPLLAAEPGNRGNRRLRRETEAELPALLITRVRRPA